LFICAERENKVTLLLTALKYQFFTLPLNIV
jgi:hypothetical protein